MTKTSDTHLRAEDAERTSARAGRDKVPPADDAALIDACIRQDQRAWRELVTRYGRLVYSIPRRYGLDEQTCDDVFQTVFSTLVPQLQRIRDPRSLPKWLITSTHRTAWRIIRDRRRQSPVEKAAMEMEDGSAPPPELSLQWERQHLLREALARMGGRCEALLTALYLDRNPPGYEAVAERLGIAVGSIGPTRARCLAKMLDICRDMGFE